jgi:hypothetical protein
LKNQIDRLVLLSTYTFRDSENTESDTYLVNLGWQRELQERLTLKILGGYRHTDRFNLQKERESTDRGVFDISFAYRWERSRIASGVNRSLATSGTGDDVEIDRLFLNYWYRLSERMRFDFLGRLLFNREGMDVSNYEGRYYLLRPSLSYNLTEVHRLTLAYEYANDYDDTLDTDKTVSRNKVWLSLQLVWPQKW